MRLSFLSDPVPHLSSVVRPSFRKYHTDFANGTGIARTVTGAIMGEANDVTSQRAPKENFGAGDIKEDVVRLANAFFWSRSVPADPESLCMWGVARGPTEQRQGSAAADSEGCGSLGCGGADPVRRNERRDCLLCAPSLHRHRTRRCGWLAEVLAVFFSS